MASTPVPEPPVETKASLSSYQTALAILLPPSSKYHEDITALRSLHDRNAKIWPPHINILYPFVAPESLPNAVDTIQKYLIDEYNGTTPVNIKLDTAGVWNHRDHATVYLSESSKEQAEDKLDVAELRKELLDLFTLPKAEKRRYIPHLTIGQSAVEAEAMSDLLSKAEKLVADATNEGIQWDAYELVVLQRGAAKSGMKIVSEIFLDNRGKAAVGERNDAHEPPDFLQRIQAPVNHTGRSQNKRERGKPAHDQPADEMKAAKPATEFVKRAKLRPAHDIINRIKWDSDLDVQDYIIGYEDRFVGVLQMNLEQWVENRRDETDEEWVPLHRVVWIKRASDNMVVWHKEERIDTIFGSGDGIVRVRVVV